MNFSFKDAEFEIPCPSCNRKFKIKLEKVGTDVICPHCKKKITLKDDGFKNSTKNVECEINNMLKNLK